ncbi:MAG: transglycosylase SLT domain-containing protein [Bacteroidales bacterium]|nr:transglycosylase SLT domain-containing protein [Bacteroidales bacterium]
MKNSRTPIITIISLLFLLVALVIINQDTAHAKGESILDGEDHPTYNMVITAPYIPVEMEFAGEKIPLTCYWVREGLDRELTTVMNQHTLTTLSIKRANRWFPVIEPLLEEEGLPEDFKYLCVAESNLQNVVSTAKACGFWQFMEKTALLYNMEVREEVDERYNLEKATRAACRYLIGSKKRLGTWSLAAAAYNMGEAGVQKQMTAQSCDNYWDLYLNQETARYMYRILAYKLVFENPERYHYKLYPEDLYAPLDCDTLQVTTTINSLYDFAKEHNITYRELKELNPWLRAKKLTVGTKPYVIQVPKK